MKYCAYHCAYHVWRIVLLRLVKVRRLAFANPYIYVPQTIPAQWFCYHLYDSSLTLRVKIHQSNATDQRNNVNHRNSDEGVNVTPDPDGCFGSGDTVDPKPGSRVGTRMNTESVSGFLQALLVVSRLRRIEGHATAALGL